MKLLHLARRFYEARLTAYEAGSSTFAKATADKACHEAHLPPLLKLWRDKSVHAAKPLSVFICFADYAVTSRLHVFFAKILAKKWGASFLFPHLFFTGESSNLFYANRNNCKTSPSRPFSSKYVQLVLSILYAAFTAVL